MNDDLENDYWSEENFEDAVASAIISCYETKILKNKGAIPSDRLSEEHAVLFRKEGPYIMSNSRLMIGEDENGKWGFDLQNDKLPISGCIGLQPDGLIKESNPTAYMQMFHVRQVNSLGHYWHRQAGGVLYEMYDLMAVSEGGITGERRYFTVDKDGVVKACIQKLPYSKGYSPGKPNSIITTEENYIKEIEAWGSVTLQSLADRRFCWSISAYEKVAKAHLGCMKEEIKSLLYARSLPLTATGRKRPILHLIESHKRRLRNGIEIDIVPFLKGQQVVEIGGTMFKVNPPAVLEPKVSANSKKRFFTSK